MSSDSNSKRNKPKGNDLAMIACSLLTTDDNTSGSARGGSSSSGHHGSASTGSSDLITDHSNSIDNDFADVSSIDDLNDTAICLADLTLSDTDRVGINSQVSEKTFSVDSEKLLDQDPQKKNRKQSSFVKRKVRKVSERTSSTSDENVTVTEVKKKSPKTIPKSNVLLPGSVPVCDIFENEDEQGVKTPEMLKSVKDIVNADPALNGWDNYFNSFGVTPSFSSFALPSSEVPNFDMSHTDSELGLGLGETPSAVQSELFQQANIDESTYLNEKSSSNVRTPVSFKIKSISKLPDNGKLKPESPLTSKKDKKKPKNITKSSVSNKDKNNLSSEENIVSPSALITVVDSKNSKKNSQPLKSRVPKNGLVKNESKLSNSTVREVENSLSKVKGEQKENISENSDSQNETNSFVGKNQQSKVIGKNSEENQKAKTVHKSKKVLKPGCDFSKKSSQNVESKLNESSMSKEVEDNDHSGILITNLSETNKSEDSCGSFVNSAKTVKKLSKSKKDCNEIDKVSKSSISETSSKEKFTKSNSGCDSPQKQVINKEDDLVIPTDSKIPKSELSVNASEFIPTFQFPQTRNNPMSQDQFVHASLFPGAFNNENVFFNSEYMSWNNSPPQNDFQMIKSGRSRKQKHKPFDVNKKAREGMYFQQPEPWIENGLPGKPNSYIVPKFQNPGKSFRNSKHNFKPSDRCNSLGNTFKFQGNSSKSPLELAKRYAEEQHPVMFILRGLPGSGKTFLAK